MGSHHTRCRQELLRRGLLFGRRLHQALKIPVGLIDNAWGGSACEAWIPRERLNATAVAKPYMELWRQTEANYDAEAAQEKYEKQKAKWTEQVKKAKADGKPHPVLQDHRVTR